MARGALKNPGILESRIRAVHGDRYQYPEGFVYDSDYHILVRCSEHGNFSQDVYSHLAGKGCRKCTGHGKSTAEWVKQAAQVHGDFYDYTVTEFKGAQKKVTIRCREHGLFEQKADNHLHGNGCPTCWCDRKANLEDEKRVELAEQFVAKATELHAGKYDYSLARYSNYKGPVLIVCPDHGEFWQAPAVQLRGGGCPRCAAIVRGSSSRKSLDDFLRQASAIHADKYDYSSVILNATHQPVTILCEIHGAFQQTPANHLMGQGCKHCSKLAMALTKRVKRGANIVDEFKQLHAGKGYTYDEFVYQGFAKKSTVVCPLHGKFDVSPANHLEGCGCPQCARENRPDFIDARVHNDPEFASRPGFLYLLRVTHPGFGGQFYKVGITTRIESLDRYQYVRYANFKLALLTQLSMSIKEAWLVEKSIKALIRNNRWGVTPFTDDYWHWTESFHGADALNQIRAFVTNAKRHKTPMGN